MGSSPYHYRLRATTFGHPKTLDEYLPLRVSGVKFCAKTEDLPARSPETAAGWAAWLRALASTMAQKTSPCLTTVQPPPGAGGCFGDFLHNQTAGLNRFAQRRGGRGPGIINAYLLAGLPQSEYNRRG
ncbi:TPA: hypothetical protein MDV22_002465 [Klebsiella pneumoniae]|nr:hypothetical protein [Klebsiella pneumoniae]HBV3672604.1 hypothetical protein [Klebsiella pneumoniae]HBY4856429.1 hypothetical protein [Klebsiella pneumoniae]